MACPVEAWKAASSVVAGENVLDSMARPQMATRGFWATPTLREASVPSSSRILFMSHSSTVLVYYAPMSAGRDVDGDRIPRECHSECHRTGTRGIRKSKAENGRKGN